MSFLFSANSNTENEQLRSKNKELKNNIHHMADQIQKLIDKNNILELKNASQIEEKNNDHIFLGKFLYERKDNVMIYVAECRKLIPNIIPWQYNRKLDDNHVEDLKNIILKTNFFLLSILSG